MSVGPKAAGQLPLLQERPFRMLTIERLSSRVANNAVNFGLVLLIVDATGRAFMSSLLVLTLVVPSTVAGLAAGAAADLFPKRLLIVTGNLVRAGVCAALAFQEPQVWAYFLVALVMASATQIATSAEAAILPTIVARERLVRANAIGHAVTGLGQILGFAVLAPLTLRLVGEPRLLFGIAAVLFLAAAAYGVAIGRQERGTRGEVGGEVRDVWWRVGWRQMRRDPRVLRAALELTLLATTMTIIAGLAPSYIEEVLNLPVEVGAVALSPAAVGIALGLRLAGWLARRVPHYALSTAGFAGFVLFVGALAFVDPLAQFLAGYAPFAWLGRVEIGKFDGGGVLAMMLVVPLGFCYALVAVAGQTTLNDLVPISLQGRVFATQGAMAALAASGPVLAFGALADAIGVEPVLALLAAATGVAAVANLRAARRQREGSLTPAAPLQSG
ncbi:MAG: MFS transporter [Chloroflexota bacterium]|nr:MFS transporter [Dehalococcoidia bacterium]MDW8045671.1 MFS transporter [Chloroflexota bacterium]